MRKVPDSMPDLRMGRLSRRTVIPLVVIITGIAVVAVALFGGSGSPGTSPTAESSGGAIKPVAPIDPDDQDATDPREGPTPNNLDDPFFPTAFGASDRRKVTVRVAGDGYVNVGLYYRDRKKPQLMVVSAHSATRTFKGRFPMAAIAIQLPGNLPGSASRATCTIVIDGVEVDTETTKKPGELVYCTG